LSRGEIAEGRNIGMIGSRIRLVLANERYKRAVTRRTAIALTALALSLSPLNVLSQHKFQKTYRLAGETKVHLHNLSGSVTVLVWERDEIKVVADMESPVAKLFPLTSQQGLTIDVVDDNRGRTDMGDVNFTINVPAHSSVDVETKRGNIIVRGITGSMVRARVTLEGDIELTGLRAFKVMASNIAGDILFDGELAPTGIYELSSVNGNINVRIPSKSHFRLTATAPLSGRIDIGRFASMGLFDMRDKRKVVGRVGEGRATFNLLNTRGQIVLTGR
jgi:hypothetical protein